MEVDPLLLPNIGDPEVTKGRYQVGVMNEALARWNLVIVIPAQGTHFHEIGYYIWSIRSPRYEGKTHAVVVGYDGAREGMSAWHVAWDPSPWRDEPGREAFHKPLNAYVFLALDPSRQVPRP